MRHHNLLNKLVSCTTRRFLDVQAARMEGDFLLVGLHSDEDVTERRGPHLPLMDLHERSLSVLACKYVDEVVIGEDFSGVLYDAQPRLRLETESAGREIRRPQIYTSASSACWPASIWRGRHR